MGNQWVISSLSSDSSKQTNLFCLSEKKPMVGHILALQYTKTAIAELGSPSFTLIQLMFPPEGLEGASNESPQTSNCTLQNKNDQEFVTLTSSSKIGFAPYDYKLHYM